MTQTTKIDLVIKFGGSAITFKDTFETLKEDSLEEAASLIQKCVAKDLKCVIVHGAGSFGHHQAKEYAVNSGFAHLDANAQHKPKIGFCLTHRSVGKLNNVIVDRLNDLGIPAIPCTPCSSWMCKNRTVVTSGLRTVQEFIDEGFVPVLHGDTVRDLELGGCILSGDTIIKTICHEFDVDRVVFLTDVPGIFDRPPDQADASLLPKITVDKDGDLTMGVKTTVPCHDVTGGIKLKIQTAVDIVTATQGRTLVYVCKLGSQASRFLCLREARTETESLTFTEIILKKNIE